MKKLKIMLIIFLLITGCGKSANRQMNLDKFSSIEEEEYAPSPPATYQEQGDISIPEKKIIKESWIRMEVEKYPEAMEKLKIIVGKYDGYITNENESSTDYSINNNLVIRVPSERFDSLVSALITVALKLDNKNVTARDVTEEFIDIEIRLKTKKEVERRYLELLKRAGTIQDILAVEQQLRVIREEIEAKEGRLQFLQHQVSYSAISLEIYQKLSYEPGFKFFKKVTVALNGGWKGLLKLVIGLVYIWPLLLVGVVLLLWLRWRRKKKK